MEVKELYKYQRGDGVTIATLIKPEAEYTSHFRIVAGEGMVITKDGENLYGVIDTDSADGWYEIEAPEETEETEEVSETE